MCRYGSRTGCVMRQHRRRTAVITSAQLGGTAVVPHAYRGHHAYVACQHSRHISRKGLMDVFLRRRKSGRKIDRLSSTQSYKKWQLLIGKV